jgi:hypothetical protein
MKWEINMNVNQCQCHLHKRHLRLLQAQAVLNQIVGMKRRQQIK